MENISPGFVLWWHFYGFPFSYWTCFQLVIASNLVFTLNVTPVKKKKKQDIYHARFPLKTLLAYNALVASTYIILLPNPNYYNTIYCSCVLGIYHKNNPTAVKQTTADHMFKSCCEVTWSTTYQSNLYDAVMMQLGVLRLTCHTGITSTLQKAD